MKIRKATKKDLERINELTIEMHNSLGKPIGLKFTKEILEKELYNESDLKTHVIYVAVIGAEIIGYICFNKEIEEDEWYGKHYHIDHIIVDENYRERGIGSKLFSIVLRKAKQRNLNIKVDTLVTNKKGINFYTKLGFRPLETYMILDLQKKLKPCKAL